MSESLLIDLVVLVAQRGVFVKFLIVLLSFSVAFLSGCGEEENPTTPENSGEGTIVIDQEPDTLTGAGWLLTGWLPDNSQQMPGSGDATFKDMPVGTYTIIWDDVSGYITPSGDSKKLTDGGTIAFNSIYVEKGTIEINQTPDDLAGAGWTLTGPQNETGSGDATFNNMPVGTYTLTWDDVSGYVTPTAESKELNLNNTVSFSGIYVELGAIVINQTPDDLAGAGWTLTGPQNETGSTDTTLTEMPLGRYMLSWDDVSGYITPVSESMELIAKGTISFSGIYVERGTIVIDQTPDDLAGASWTLIGEQYATGSGDTTLTDMLVGTYTLIWADLSDYVSPSEDTKVLSAGGTIAFSGTYERRWPLIIGSVDTPSFARVVTLSGSYAYVADATSGLQVVNIGIPSAPVIIGSVDTPGSASVVTLSGSYAYVADAGSGLQVVDISTPTSPVIIGSVETPGDAISVAISGSYAYVADNFAGLQVVYIGIPSAPVIIGSVDTPGSANGVAVSGSYVYLADGYSGLQVIDVSSPP